MTEPADTVRVLTVDLEDSPGGLFRATSAHLPGLLVAEETVPAIYDELPRAIEALVEEEAGEPVTVMRAAAFGRPAHGWPITWAVVPTN